ncbi:MAG TPA: protease pro-enzyme activation domain-containing protein [Bryobacteraceae bacterium]|nr:protease pro-enzyme activation domain-containing protein [Bryobacteraceae bacterium]
MMLKQTPAQRAALDQLLADQQDASSPNFHKWLTPEEFADRFGASQSDLGKLSAWLTSAGFTIEYTARGRDWLSFSGTAAQVEATFLTPVHLYRSAVETHYSISSEPSIPAELEPLVGTLLDVDDFRPRSALQSRPGFTSRPGSFSLAPGDLGVIYGFNRLYQGGFDGTGQNIVIVGQSAVDLNDITQFRARYQLPATTVQVKQVGNDPGFNDALIETDLDLEWIGAIAPRATMIYVYSTSADYSAFYAIDQNLAPVISESFGLCEAEISSGAGPFYQNEAKKANALGITWLVSSGDSGAAGCDYGATTANRGLAVSFPASVPEVTAVGGSEFNEGSGTYWSPTNGTSGASALSYIPEMGWNDTAYGGGLASTGGGVSMLFAKPSWQTGTGVPNDRSRDVPDVSMAAASGHDPYIIFTSGQTATVGGTSAATPVFAGLVALLNQYQKSNGSGNINIGLYSNAQSAPAMFHDIVSGSNIVPCQSGTANCANGQFGYSAGAGYDLVTGLGSVDAYNLVTGWAGSPAASVTISSLTPASATAGTGAFTLTVNGSGFAAGATVQWNGTALITKLVNATQVQGSVPAGLIATAGVASVTVSSSGKTSGAASFTITAAEPPAATFGSQRVTAQAPAASGCVLPTAATSFTTTDNTVYLYFVAQVSASDLVSYNWLSPDGSTVSGGSWPQQAGNYCFTGPNLSVINLTGARLGNWQARVFDNGKQMFTVPFTVSAVGVAAPVISSLRNAASFTSGTISPGEIVVILGTGLGPVQISTLTYNSAGIAESLLAGTTVQFNGFAAPLVYTTTTAVAAIVPYEVTTGTAQVTVTYQGRVSAPLAIPVAPSTPGIFTANASGSGQVAALNQDGTVNTASKPAPQGSTVVLYGTGEGQTSPDGLDGKPVGFPLPHPVLPFKATIGGVQAQIAYIGGTPTQVAGLFQLNVIIPPGVVGSAVPVTVQAGDVQSQPGTTIAVAAANAPFTVTSRMTTAATVKDSSGNLTCATPVSKSSFLTTDSSVALWFTFNGVKTGDILSFSWIHPSGLVEPKSSATLGFSGSGCASSTRSIATQLGAEAGTWQVRVSLNDNEQFNQTFTLVTPAPVFTVTAKATAGALGVDSAGIANLCVTPTSKTTFLASDPSVWVWFTYNGVQNGDTYSYNWIHPSGAVDGYQPSSIVGFSGSGCSAWSFDIAGSGAANEPGTWQVRVSRNGTSLFTLPFTISNPAFTVKTSLTSASVVTNSTGGLSCTVPTSKTKFVTTDPSVYVWFNYDNVKNGDTLSFNWIHPSGALDSYQPSTTVPFDGSGCTAWSFNIAGTSAAREPGVWQVRVLRNGAAVFTLPFTIALPSPDPFADNLSMLSNRDFGHFAEAGASAVDGAALQSVTAGDAAGDTSLAAARDGLVRNGRSATIVPDDETARFTLDGRQAMDPGTGGPGNPLASRKR